MLKAIFFDMDGVLINSQDAWFSSFNAMLKEFENKKISREEFEKHIWAQEFRKTYKKYFKTSLENLEKFRIGNQESFLDNLKEMSGAQATLQKLKERYRLAVVSNSKVSICESMLKKNSLFEYFDFIMGPDKVNAGKPAPDMILKALQEMNLKKEEVVFVGDTQWDAMAAKAAGITFIGFGIDGDKRVDSLIELIDVCK